MESRQVQDRPRTSWPLLWLAASAALGVAVISLGSSLDGNDHVGIGFTAILIVLVGLRYGIAVFRHEQGKTWILYAVTLVLGPVVWMLAEYLYTIGTLFDKHPAP